LSISIAILIDRVTVSTKSMWVSMSDGFMMVDGRCSAFLGFGTWRHNGCEHFVTRSHHSYTSSTIILFDVLCLH
jgi:hypothetical protein